MKDFADLEIQEVKTFMGLGLTKNQTRIYLTLTQSGISTVKQISNTSKVARELVYRICPKLVDLGLIEKIITSPIRFRAMPIEEGISLLTERRTQEINDLHKRAITFAAIAKKRGKKKDETNFQKNHSDFMMISRKAALIKGMKQSIDSAQKSLSIITSMKRHSKALFVFDEETKNALSRGVKFRVIASEVKENPPEIAKKFNKHPLTTIKYTSCPTTVGIMLTDGKEAFVIMEPTAALEESPALQIKNPTLITLLKECFENRWSKMRGENQSDTVNN